MSPRQPLPNLIKNYALGPKMTPPQRSHVLHSLIKWKHEHIFFKPGGQVFYIGLYWENMKKTYLEIQGLEP